VDYYFADSNVWDAFEPDVDEAHNICSRRHNRDGATCGVQGPRSLEDCSSWFQSMWLRQMVWLETELAMSDADWQVVVTHFPPTGSWGEEQWASLSNEQGIDLSAFHSMSHTDKDRVLSICATNDCVTLTAAIQTTFKAAPWFMNLPPEMQAHILSVLDVAARANLRGIGMLLSAMESGLLPREEFHTDILLTGAPKTLPPWLTERGRRLLREKVAEGRFETFLGPILELKGIERFDFVSLSNIYDFISDEAAVVSIKEVAAAILKPNGEILVRKAVGRTPH